MGDPKKVKLLIMDVDGVLTDGGVILGKNEELKCFNIHDGMGIAIARKSSIKTGIITNRKSAAVEKRAKELRIDFVFQGCAKKLDALERMLNSENLNYENVCYIGDDIIDIPVFRKVGFSAAVHDAPDIVKKEADYTAKKNGGKGAVREIIEHILKAQGKLDSTVEEMIREWSN